MYGRLGPAQPVECGWHRGCSHGRRKGRSHGRSEGRSHGWHEGRSYGWHEGCTCGCMREERLGASFGLWASHGVKLEPAWDPCMPADILRPMPCTVPLQVLAEMLDMLRDHHANHHNARLEW
jgi:hypothetical protein